MKDDRFEARTNFFNVVVLRKELHTLYHQMYGFKGNLVNFETFRDFLKYLGRLSDFSMYHERISRVIQWIRVLENNYTGYQLMEVGDTTYEAAKLD